MTTQTYLSADGLSWWDGSTWRSLVSLDGTSRWDGSRWVPLAGGESPHGAGPRARGLLIGILAGGVVVIALAAYLLVPSLHPHLTLVSSGADSAAQFQSEMRYRAAYQRDAIAVRKDSAPFAPSPSSPGVCNRGGSKQACSETDSRVEGDLRTLLRDLEAVAVPDRYRTADADLKAGVRLSIEALVLRNQTLASTDPKATFTVSNEKFSAALVLLQRAAGEYPADSRPEPSLV